MKEREVVRISLPKELHSELKKKASKELLTMSSIIRIAIKKYLSK